MQDLCSETIKKRHCVMGKVGNLFSSLQANCKEHNYQIDIDQITLETKENAQEGKKSIK